MSSGDRVRAKALTKQYAASAAPELRVMWQELRDACEHYGLGRSEVLPFRKEAAAVACYVGKYLEGGLSYRRDEWKGVRRVEYSRGKAALWKSCASSFGWNSPGAKAFRLRAGELGAAVGVTEEEGISSKLGTSWAYHLRPVIMLAKEEEWRRALQVWARLYGGHVKRKVHFFAMGEVQAWYPASDEGLDCGMIYTKHGAAVLEPPPFGAFMTSIT
jgi:hypothetical protein